MEREIFRAGGLVVRGLEGGRTRFVTLTQAAELTRWEQYELIEALRKWQNSYAADNHLERVARLSTASVG